jgi:hypothetical protein
MIVTIFLVHGRVLLHDRQVIVGMVTVQIVLKPEKQTLVSRDSFRLQFLVFWGQNWRVFALGRCGASDEGGWGGLVTPDHSNPPHDVWMIRPLKRQSLEICSFENPASELYSMQSGNHKWNTVAKVATYINSSLQCRSHAPADTNESHGKLRRKISWHCSFNRYNTHVLALLSTVYRQYSEEREILRSTRPFLPPFPN